MQKIKRLAASLIAGLTSAAMLAAPVAAASTTLVVTPGNTQGWMFNRDANNATPIEFTEDEASIGQGSLYVLPIGSTAAHKFIAENPVNTPVSDVQSISYDYQIAGDGTADDADQFYLNVYTLLPDTAETYYSCRFDYVPTTADTGVFNTAEFTSTDTPTRVAARNGAVCPATLAEMPAGSTLTFFSLNLGDTSANDEGLAGYLDNVVFTTLNDETVYDFELNEPAPEMPSNKDDCKNGGWKTYDVFKNQGDCVSFVASQGRNQPAYANQNQMRF